MNHFYDLPEELQDYILYIRKIVFIQRAWRNYSGWFHEEIYLKKALDELYKEYTRRILI